MREKANNRKINFKAKKHCLDYCQQKMGGLETKREIKQLTGRS